MACRPRLAPLGLAAVCLLCAAAAAPASAAPANDAFKNAQTVRIGSSVKGTVNGATKQRGEPAHGRSLAKHSVWYRFATARKVAVGLNTCTSNFDTLIAVYSGGRLGSLREVEFNNNGGCGNGASRVIFTARPGRVYRIAVAGFTPRGRFRLQVRRINTPPNDDFVDAVRLPLGRTIAGTLVNSTRELDEPIFQGETGTVWFSVRVSQRRSVEVSACESSPIPYLAVYTGRRVNRLDRIVGDGDCSEQFTARAGTTYWIQATMEANLQSGFRIRARAASG